MALRIVFKPMSGHSKWSQIKRQKGANDVKRGAIFTKMTREIMLAAREGGGDPEGNFRLRLAMDRARAVNVPIANIQRAIDRATGGADGVQVESIVYEGYGPGGVSIMVEAATDSRNRTAAEVRAAFTRHNGKLGESGSVGWLFEKKGYLVVSKSAKPEEELFDIAIEAGADDLRDDEDNFEIITSPENFDAVHAAVKSAGIEPQVAEVSMVPQNYVKLEGSNAQQMLRLMEALEDHDDVQKVHANFDISEADMAAA